MSSKEFSDSFTLEDLKGVSILELDEVQKSDALNCARVFFGKKENTYQVHTDLNSALELYKITKDKLKPRLNMERAEGRRNCAEQLDKVFTDDKSWRGSDPKTFLEECNGKINLAPYEKIQKKISGIPESLSEYLQRVRPVRKRTLSDKDGDYQLERRWDINPFASTENKINSKTPKLNIFCDISFSASYDSEEIQKHCMFVWALVDLLEKHGILCSVYTTHWVSSLAQSGKCNAQFVYLLKRYDDYVSMGALARGLSAGFYRRVCFMFMTNLAAYLKKDVAMGLGYPIHDKLDKIKFFENGNLYLRARDTEELLNKNPKDASKLLLDKMLPGLEALLRTKESEET
jgi:hypothetical protein